LIRTIKKWKNQEKNI